MNPRFPNAKIQYAVWSNPETLRKEAEMEIRRAGGTLDDVLAFRKDCRGFTSNFSSADSLANNTLKHWVTVEKMTGKRKNWA